MADLPILIPTSTRFTGARTAVAPLTWAQRKTWADVQHFLPETRPFAVLKSWLPVPQPLSSADVVELVGELVGRHESLRTRFEPDEAGVVVQHVVDAGTGEVLVFQEPMPSASRMEQLLAWLDDLISAPFDHAAALPVRPVLLAPDGRPHTLVLAVSHLAVDGQALDVITDELTAALAARAAGLPAPCPAVGSNPVDEAAFEQSPAGVRLNQAALAYLGAQWERIPPSLFGAPVAHDAARFRRGELASRVLPLVLPGLAKRLRTTASVLLLAASVAQLHELTGQEQIPVNLLCGNRWRPHLRTCVATLAQAVLATIPVGDRPFAEVVTAGVPVQRRVVHPTGQPAGADPGRRRGRGRGPAGARPGGCRLPVRLDRAGRPRQDHILCRRLRRPGHAAVERARRHLPDPGREHRGVPAGRGTTTGGHRPTGGQLSDRT